MVISSLRAHILSAYFRHHPPAAQWLAERKPKGWINRLTNKPSTMVPTCLRSFHGMDVDQCVLRTIHGGVGGTICRVHHLLRWTDLVIGVDDLGHSSSVWNKMHLGQKKTASTKRSSLRNPPCSTKTGNWPRTPHTCISKRSPWKENTVNKWIICAELVAWQRDPRTFSLIFT